MTPTPEQIRQAIANEKQPERTAGARARDALQHAKQPTKRPMILTGIDGPKSRFRDSNYDTDTS